MKICCVVSIVRVDLWALLRESIERQEVAGPDYMVLIDNSSEGIPEKETKTTTIIRKPRPLMVNESWNLGRMVAEKRTDADILTVLNDDVILNNQFFPRIREGFNYLGEECAAICPNTSTNINWWLRFKYCNTPCLFSKMQKREGWAYSIKSDVLRGLPLIPADVLKTFCGDDWLWYFSHRNGFSWFKDESNFIYHKVGASVKGTPHREKMNDEKKVFAKLINDYEAGRKA